MSGSFTFRAKVAWTLPVAGAVFGLVSGVAHGTEPAILGRNEMDSAQLEQLIGRDDVVVTVGTVEPSSTTALIPLPGARPQAPPRSPHPCPVCTGRGLVPAGFYSRLPITGADEGCRSCDGTGVVWDGRQPARVGF